MIVYGEVCSMDRAPEVWLSSSWDLMLAREAIEKSYGDTSYRSEYSGRPNYVTLELQYSHGRTEPSIESFYPKVANFFLVLVQETGIQIIAKVRTGEPSKVDQFTYDEPWFQGVVETFRKFRQSLSDE
jgi:hypothetical protein